MHVDGMTPLLSGRYKGIRIKPDARLAKPLAYEDMGYADMSSADRKFWFRSTFYFWPLA